MKPFAIVAPRRENVDAPMWVGLHQGEARLINDVVAALQFAREQDARMFITTYLDPAFEWGVTQDFTNPPVPGEGGFSSASSDTVFSDPRCTFNYCPTPERCRDTGCEATHHPAAAA